MSAALAGELNAQMRNQDAFIAAAYQRVLSREPSDEELELCREFLTEQSALVAQTDAVSADAKAREGLVRVLLNHNDFVTIR